MSARLKMHVIKCTIFFKSLLVSSNVLGLLSSPDHPKDLDYTRNHNAFARDASNKLQKWCHVLIATFTIKRRWSQVSTSFSDMMHLFRNLIINM